MIELMKKDWRINRTILIGNVVLVAVFDLIIILSVFWDWNQLAQRGRLMDSVRDMLLTAGAVGIGVTVLLTSVYGGVAFALERSERSADFLAMLPVRRSRIVISKLVVAGVCIAVMIALNLVPLLLATYLPGFASHGLTLADFVYGSEVDFSFVMLLFGTGWLCSSFLESPSISACIAIGVVFADWAIYWAINGPLLGIPRGEVITVPAWSVVSMLLGFTALAIGTMHYIRRVEP